MNPPSTSILGRTILPKFGVIIFLRRLFSWCTIRRLFFFLACFATLLAIFYAEEDWRGHRDWEKCKRAAEAKGYSFEWRSFIPQPVPDEQNFALSPFFAEAQATWDRGRGSKALLDTNLIEHLRVNIYRLINTTSERAERPGLGYWASGTNTDLEKWQGYYRSSPNLPAKRKESWGEVDGRTFPTTPQPQSPAADVLLALSKHDDTMNELRSAAQKPLSRFPIDYDGPTYSILLPHLARLKAAASHLQLQSAALLDSGKTEAAAANVNLIFYLADSVKTEPFLISYLVRAAIFHIGLDVIWEGMNQHRWSAEQLAGFEEKLGRTDMLRDYVTKIEAEVSGHCLYMDQLQSNPDLVGEIGILTDRELTSDSFATKCFKSFRRGIFLRFAPKGWFDELKVEITQLGFDETLQAVHPETGRVDVKVSDSPEAHARLLAARSRLWLSEMIMTDYVRSIRQTAHIQTALNIGATACALERYWLANGRYPEQLDDLAPQFIKKAPVEVTSGEPLKYRREANGRFVLYSTGLSGQDFGGARRYANGKFNDNWVWSNEPR